MTLVLYEVKALPHVTRNVAKNTKTSFRFSGRVWERDYSQTFFNEGQLVLRLLRGVKDWVHRKTAKLYSISTPFVTWV